MRDQSPGRVSPSAGMVVVLALVLIAVGAVFVMLDDSGIQTAAGGDTHPELPQEDLETSGEDDGRPFRIPGHQALTPDSNFYPPPSPSETPDPTPSPNATWVAWDDTKFVDSVIDSLENRSLAATGPFTVVAQADIYPEDGPQVSLIPDEVEYGIVPDFALVIQGQFERSGRVYPYKLTVYDRGYGITSEMWAHDLDFLLGKLP